MSDLDPANVDATQDGASDEEDLAAAYEALAEDRRHQETERTAVSAARSSEPPPDEEAASVVDDAPNSAEPATDGSVPPRVPRVADDETGMTALPTDQATEESPVAEPDTQTPSRRVFVIDNKEYPDPGPELPITGARSVQAMYRDYFPGQLDNVDVAQKTRADGTVEVTFKRRIGTKGANVRSTPAPRGQRLRRGGNHPPQRCPSPRRPAPRPTACLGPRRASDRP